MTFNTFSFNTFYLIAKQKSKIHYTMLESNIYIVRTQICLIFCCIQMTQNKNENGKTINIVVSNKMEQCIDKEFPKIFYIQFCLYH